MNDTNIFIRKPLLFVLISDELQSLVLTNSSLTFVYGIRERRRENNSRVSPNKRES